MRIFTNWWSAPLYCSPGYPNLVREEVRFSDGRKEGCPGHFISLSPTICYFSILSPLSLDNANLGPQFWTNLNHSESGVIHWSQWQYNGVKLVRAESSLWCAAYSEGNIWQPNYAHLSQLWLLGISDGSQRQHIASFETSLSFKPVEF